MGNVFELHLNGHPLRVEGCSPNATLLDFLRARGLSGSKEGCAEGDCGACTVVLRERDTAGQTVWRSINSCIVPVALLAGREVVTVEGVARNGELHPIQQAMAGHHGSQCGYCTPGFICSLFEGYHRRDLKEQWQLDDQLCGNLCRCTGYRSICDAAWHALGQKAGEAAAASVSQPNQASLKTVEYETGGEVFFRPDSLAEVLRLLRRYPNARLIAGATELGLDIAKRFKKFPVLVSLEGVPELHEIRETRKAWFIGAAATLTEVEDKAAREYPPLQTMLRLFGSRQIRNRATMGGNLVMASPIGDSAPFLLAHDARVAIAGRGPRELALERFFTGYRQTALQEREVLTQIVLPRNPSLSGVKRFSAFYKVSKRREMDIATVSACFVLELDRQDSVQHVRLAFGGVAPMPIRARRTEQAMMGRKWNPKMRAKAAKVLAMEFTPISDVRGSAEYRRALVTSLLEKFFHEEVGEASPNVTRLASNSEFANPKSEMSILAPGVTPHESARLHVTGEALYADDQTRGMLETWPVCATHAHARILRRDATVAREMPGIRAVLLAEDVPGSNDVGVVREDEILLAQDKVSFHGHIVALVVGESLEACRAAAERVVVEYEPLQPLLAIEAAIVADSFHTQPNFIRRGDTAQALRDAPHSFEGTFAAAGQDHFYLETHAAWARPGEDGTMLVVSSTQHPSEVQTTVAGVLGVSANKVIVQAPRLGGGFGGKETQAATPAALAALAAAKTGQAARVRWNRDQDMMLTGKRHPFLARFQVGFDDEGLLRGAKIDLFSNGGWSLDLSSAVTDRALFHLDNAYYIPAVEFSGRVCKTNLASNTAFRGFGGPQGMLVIEEIMDRVARRLSLPPEVVRERNLYRGAGETNTTHYGQEIGNESLQTIWQQLKGASRFDGRRHEVAEWNRRQPHRKRGLAITPVKFGISFTTTPLNHAGALVLLYLDGSVQVNHGGTEMGQGVHTNIVAIAAKELGVTPDKIRVMPTSTDKVPNTSATAASCGTDLNGAAVKNACDLLRARLGPAAATLLSAKSRRDVPADKIVFEANRVFAIDAPDVHLAFIEVVRKAHSERISLSATGYYRTPDIYYDREKGRGHPFYYFACGAAVTEVEVDGFTGMIYVRRVDILHDVGQSINASINRGQIEGGFVQGTGWLTCEELKWDEQGRLLTHSPDTYKIPSVGDRPREFNVTFLKNSAQPGVVHGSKAVGEPPLMLAISVREAIRDAVAAFGPAGGEVALPTPATCEAIFMAIQRRRQSSTGVPHGGRTGAVSPKRAGETPAILA
jgi:xanthine dehydrogenase molybdopterin binding subunit/xanthine dehydrogenase small subunit